MTSHVALAVHVAVLTSLVWPRFPDTRRHTGLDSSSPVLADTLALTAPPLLANTLASTPPPLLADTLASTPPTLLADTLASTAVQLTDLLVCQGAPRKTHLKQCNVSPYKRCSAAIIAYIHIYIFASKRNDTSSNHYSYAT